MHLSSLGLVSKKEIYLRSKSDIFAYVLSKQKNYKIYAIVEDRFINGQVLEALIHAFCVPNVIKGEIGYQFEEIIDAYGRRNFEDMLTGYDINNFRIVEHTRETILKYGDRDHNLNELLSEIKKAEAFCFCNKELFK